jgi:NADPH-dependent 2,4-dienoyl-CoA reductase/sulfur reductase-like enzyme
VDLSRSWREKTRVKINRWGDCDRAVWTGAKGAMTAQSPSVDRHNPVAMQAELLAVGASAAGVAAAVTAVRQGLNVTLDDRQRSALATLTADSNVGG